MKLHRQMSEDGMFTIETGVIAILCNRCPFRAFTYNCEVAAKVQHVHRKLCCSVSSNKREGQMSLAFPLNIRRSESA